MVTPNMFRVMGDGVEIQYARWSEGGRTVVCVHGLTANCRCWGLIAEALAPTYRVLAPDLRGRGLSGKPETGYSLEAHARDIGACLDNIQPGKVILIGHSLGAYISLAVAATRPDLVEKLVLLDGGAPLSREAWAKVAEGIKPSLERLGKSWDSVEEMIEEQKKNPVLQPWSAVLDEYFRYEAHEVDGRIRSRINPAHIEEERTNMVRVDTNPYYPKIKCPVLIVRATKGMMSDDDLVLPEPALAALQKALPEARVVNLEGMHHYSMIFQPSDVRDRALLEFAAD